MKKLLFVLMALFATVGSRAQNYDGVYTLGVDVNKRRGYVCAGENYSDYPVLTGITWSSYTDRNTDAVENGKNWYLKEAWNETGYYIYNVALGKFLVRDNNNVNFGDVPEIWDIIDYNGYKLIMHVDVDANKLMSGACGSQPSDRNVKFNTSRTDGGSLYTIEEVSEGKTTFAIEINAANARIVDAEPRITITIKANGALGEYTQTAKVNAGTVNVNECFHEACAKYMLNFSPATITVEENGTHEFEVTYTQKIPFASNFDGLDGKWVSFFTYYGRMHVYDENCEYVSGTNTIKRYPCIDKATFTNLTDRKFWGFICENPFTSRTVKIVNKGATEEKGTLWLTRDASDAALLFAKEKGNYFTDEWVLEKGRTKDGEQYYGLKAKGTDQRINNKGGVGFMITNPESALQDAGSSIKFTTEYQTYQTLKERALNAPYHAAHSLNEDARKAIKDADNALGDNPSETDCLNSYKAVIADINNTSTNAGFINFDETKYYYLRNYTPAGGNTYVLASSDGTNARGVLVPSDQIGSADEPMTYSDINAIWKITQSANAAPPYEVGSGDIGISKTIGRDVTHVNSGNKLTTSFSNGNAQLTSAGVPLYFVNLGAGQHFIKDKQYNGSGQQAKAGPFTCADNGNVSRLGDANAHYKNSRCAWYGIEVSEINVAIGATGYATIHLPFGVTLPEETDLKAYAVTAAGNGIATLTEVTSIPANEGVILKGKENTSYTLTINDAVEAWAEGYNKLKGSNSHKTITVDAYVLSQPQDKEVGLYKAATSNGSWLNNDNKAYLPASAIGTPEEARFLSFDFGTETGLDVISGGVEPASTESVVYDLSGRRVRNALKGMYIVNGKKVVK